MAVENDLSAKDWKDIGTRIKNRRNECGIKQIELAEKVGVSLSHMSSIESGKQHPSIYVIIKLSEVLNTTPDFFLVGNTRPKNVPQNIVDSINMCDESFLPLIEKLVEVFRNYRQ